ncbi:MAG: hypothetical protein QXQ91_02400 [Nanopusillaceae archaeon]
MEAVSRTREEPSLTGALQRLIAAAVEAYERMLDAGTVLVDDSYAAIGYAERIVLAEEKSSMRIYALMCRSREQAERIATLLAELYALNDSYVDFDKFLRSLGAHIVTGSAGLSRISVYQAYSLNRIPEEQHG